VLLVITTTPSQPQTIPGLDDRFASIGKKENGHLRRSGKYSPDIVLEGKSPAFKDQSALLCNDNNMKSLIGLLTSCLQLAGIKVH